MNKGKRRIEPLPKDSGPKPRQAYSFLASTTKASFAEGFTLVSLAPIGSLLTFSVRPPEASGSVRKAGNSISPTLAFFGITSIVRTHHLQSEENAGRGFRESVRHPVDDFRLTRGRTNPSQCPSREGGMGSRPKGHLTPIKRVLREKDLLLLSVWAMPSNLWQPSPHR